MEKHVCNNELEVHHVKGICPGFAEENFVAICPHHHAVLREAGFCSELCGDDFVPPTVIRESREADEIDKECRERLAKLYPDETFSAKEQIFIDQARKTLGTQEVTIERGDDDTLIISANGKSLTVLVK